jgi:hypothetical protein
MSDEGITKICTLVGMIVFLVFIYCMARLDCKEKD